MQHIIVADDHSMIRKGLKLLLTSRLSCKSVNEADSCHKIMNELKHAACTHLILDVIFPDGTSLEIVPVIKKLYPEVKIMIYTMQPEAVYGEAFRQYDVQYYLSKAAPEEETINAITHFLNNDVNTSQGKTQSKHTNPLAPRDLEILHYLLNGFKTNDIATTLNLSNSTVSTFKKRIFEKTGTDNIAQIYEMASINNLGFLSGPPKVK